MAPFLLPKFEENPMKNFVQHGEMVTVIAAAIIASGDLVRVNSLIGVAATDAAIGEAVEVKTSGVFDLPKTSAQAWSAGQPVYMISGTGLLTNVAGTGNYLAGVAVLDAANPSATGRVRLNGSLGHPVTA
jgi:predicted RecA/RadA family phage recombinase